MNDQASAIEVAAATYRYPGSLSDQIVGLTLRVPRGRTLGVVGESGSGKSTLARLIAGSIAPTAGTVQVLGRPAFPPRGRPEPRPAQLIFQNPYSALNPRQTVESAVAEAARVATGASRAASRQIARRLFSEVGLGSERLDSLPGALSGGQRQRVAIARALACEPKVLVADEPTSALDVSIQAQILNLILRIREERELTLVIVSHDLAVIGHMSDQIAVMRDGRLVEVGTRDDIVERPEADYTRELFAATRRMGGASWS